MRKAIIIIVMVMVASACSHLRHVQVVERVSTDTLYLNSIQYDSVYVENQHSSDYHPSLPEGDGDRPDTLLIHDIQREYRYKFLRDTVHRVQVDSVPVIRTVEVVRTERHVPSIYKWSLAICIILLCLSCVFCVLKIKL